MKKILLIFSALLVLGFSQSCNSDSKLDKIASEFQNPPTEAGVRCWWWWLNSNVTKKSITQDLEAMADKGFSGAMIFDAGTELHWGPDSPPPNGPMFSSPEWTELYLHALNEAERLNMKLGVSIQSGWNLGGPTITLDDAAKQITWSEIDLKGPKINEKLAIPPHNHDYYKDICVLAFPARGKNNRQSINNLSAKAGFRELGGSAPDCRFLLNDVPAAEGEEDTMLGDIIDISDKMDDNGVLNWETSGNWTIMRFGFTPTLAHVSTSSDNWKGHVLDYLDKDVFNNYWDEIVDPLLQAAGPMAGTVLTHLETDSWECGGMNWSTRFPEYFKKYSDYDIIKYLPVVAGKIIDDRHASNAFLADLRKTIAACVSENHYKTFAERAAEYNMGIQPESAGPHAAPIDGITNYSHSDIVMSEFWAPSPHRPKPENRFFVKQASSAAHIYGKQFVGAEAFTSIRNVHWGPVLWKEQKPSMDHEFCSGLNMIFFHTYTNSPDEMGEPGQEYFAGTHVNRHVSWWNLSDAFMDYIKRVQYVVQQGKFVADVLYYYGDHVPNIASLKESDPAGVLPGYDYDVTNEDVLLKSVVVDGKVVVPGGISYKMLVLPDHKVLSVAAIKQVKKLLNDGATIMGPKPERLVSLAGGIVAQREFHSISDSLWGANPQPQGHNAIGKGHLVWGFGANEFFRSAGHPMDFEIVSFKNSPSLDYIHYEIDGADVYFVSNQSQKAQTTGVKFRVSDKQPEIWDPVTGQIRNLTSFKQKGGTTEILLDFDPYESYFVVFNDELSDKSSTSSATNFPKKENIQEIQGPWELSFDTKWGGPAKYKSDKLFDWAKSKDERIKYYSGEVEYVTSFQFDKKDNAKTYWIELNQVEDVGIASIELNGEDLGIVWTPPFRMDISNSLKKGENQLSITVVNNWVNRLLGDRDLPTGKRYTNTNLKIKDNWKVQKSGLLGPVVILQN